MYLGRFSKTQSGVRIQELAIGNGLEATRGDSVEFDYVLRSACLPFTLHTNHSGGPPRLLPSCLQLYATLCTCKVAGADTENILLKLFRAFRWPRLSARRV